MMTSLKWKWVCLQYVNFLNDQLPMSYLVQAASENLNIEIKIKSVSKQKFFACKTNRPEKGSKHSPRKPLLVGTSAKTLARNRHVCQSHCLLSFVPFEQGPCGCEIESITKPNNRPMAWAFDHCVERSDSIKNKALFSKHLSLLRA